MIHVQIPDHIVEDAANILINNGYSGLEADRRRSGLRLLADNFPNAKLEFATLFVPAHFIFNDEVEVKQFQRKWNKGFALKRMQPDDYDPIIVLIPDHVVSDYVRSSRTRVMAMISNGQLKDMKEAFEMAMKIVGDELRRLYGSDILMIDDTDQVPSRIFYKRFGRAQEQEAMQFKLSII